MASIVTYGIGTVETQSEISGVQFGIMSADEIRQMSVVECDEITLYNKGVPTPRGILDHRMGTVDRRLLCGTCGQDVRTCPGHWGRIELPLPVFHVAFVETARKVLNCICHSCSRIRLSEAEAEQLPTIPDGTTQRKQRLTIIYSSCRNKKICPHCSCPCPVISRAVGNTKLVPDWDHIDASTFESEEESAFCKKIVFTPQTAFEMLSYMTDEDIILLGLDPKTSHPKNMILHALLVPPPIIRPSIMVSEGSRARGQDDLTVRLLEIVKRVVQLKDLLDSAENGDTPEINDMWERMAQDIGVYMHNNPRGNKVATQRSGVPTKCLFSRLKGKQGRFRSNLMGKRVNFSGRSVISPDPLLDVDEVGIPEAMALQLTIQERVNMENIDDLLARVVKGAARIDGAETVITCDGTSIQLEYCTTRDQIALQEGWIVERPIRSGDWVLFNRQPTLHRSSLMGHRVVIVPGKTLRCNLAVVSPYNADFDGDEMNVHVPQSPAAVAEVRGIMSVTEQLVSPQAAKPVMGIVQDALLGAHLLTSPDVLLDRHAFMSIILSARQYGKNIEARSTIPSPVYIHPVPLWTGKQLVEVLMPPVTLIHGDIDDIWEAAEDDGAISTVATHPLIVRNGKFLSGQFNKSTIGVTTGSLVHHVILSAGNKTAVMFMGDIQRVVNRWLIERGFSIGIGDCVPSRTCNTNMREGIDEAMKRIDTLQTEIPRWSSATLGDGDRGRVSLEKIAVERTIHRMVGRVQMSTGSLVRKEMSHGNGLGAMVLAGSKGNNINICQIMLCVGQNCVNGERIGRDGPDKRTLPGYAQGDASVDGAGFVSNSYLLGLTASEAFFHAKGGREGLVDTSVKTSRTGYIQRRLVKGMESHRAEHDLTVRDASNNIIEFVYGGDGMNPAKLERSEFDAFAKSDKQLHDECVHKSATEKERKLQEKEWKRLLETRNENRSNRIHVLMTKIHKTVDLAVNPRRVLLMTVAQRKLSRRKCDRVTVKMVNSSLDEMVQMLLSTFSAQASCNLRLALLSELRSAIIVHTHYLSKNQWTTVLETIKTTILGAIVETGEMVGCIAAQSIGEPATQMSMSYSTEILCAINGEMKSAPIGEVIDAHLPPVTSSDQHDVLPVSKIMCTGVSPTETVKWANITHVSRHPANGDMVTVTTEHNRTLKATASHSFLVREGNRIVPRQGSDLVIGDFVPVVKDMPSNPEAIIPSAPVPLSHAVGRLLGAVLSEGTVYPTTMLFSNTQKAWAVEIAETFSHETNIDTCTRYFKMSEQSLGSGHLLEVRINNKGFAEWVADNFGCKSFDKMLPAWILDAPAEFLTGVLQTFFDGDGNVQTEAGHHRICCHTVSDDLVPMLCLCLARFGIATYVGKEKYRTPAGKPGIINRINIPLCFAAKFQEHIGFSIDYKVARLQDVVNKQASDSTQGWQTYVPGMNALLEELREHVPCGGNKNSFETLLRKELRRIQRKSGITPQMLLRCRDHALKFDAPESLIAEFDQAINADVWWDKIVSIEVERDSQEMVYDFTVDKKLQSFMLSNGVFVHNTLNSVDWETPMAIHWTANEPPPAAHDAEVGAFIDALIEKHPKDCQIQPDGVTVYLPLPPGTAKALSPDENGTMMWTELEAVTRHPPINKDGSDTLVEVMSESGRQVIVTKGKSLLIERDGKLVDVDGDSVQIGDRVPIVNDLPSAPDQCTLDLHTIFKENEAVFTDVILEAQEAWSNHRRWFDAFKHRSVYSRSDAMRDAVKKRPALLEPGKVFWAFGGSPLPVNIPLDRDFGFFVGAYLAEGCVTEHQVHISNVDEAYRTAACVWPHRHGINSHTTNEKHQKKNNGTSISVMFHSKLLVQLLTRSCGKLSAGKRVPGFALAAPDEFVEGLLDGYISGEGSVNKRYMFMSASSRSRLLRDGIATLLSRFGVTSRLSNRQTLNHVKWTTRPDGQCTQEKYGELTPMYELSVHSDGTHAFAENVNLSIQYKQDRCDEIVAEYANTAKRQCRDNRMNNVRLEAITELNEVKSSHEFVYDLTVASTRNMTSTNGFACADTFHLAGVAMEGRSQLSGIPRVAEIIDATRNIKTATMTLRIQDESIKADQQRAEVYARSLEHCPLARLVSMYEVENCPSATLSKGHPEDSILIISKLLCDSTEEDEPMRANNTLRLVLNRRLLRRRGLIPSSVLAAILNQHSDSVEGVASSEASIDWVIRLRARNVTLNADAARVYSHIMETTVVGGRVEIELAEMIKLPSVKEYEDGRLDVEDELAIETAGSALGAIAWEPELDWTSCTSNDIMDVYNTLGIAAARIVIFHELRNLVAGDSSKVNDRHIMMVATSMTHYGTVMPMSRHGINRIAETGPLLRCSFEETSEVLTDAGIYGESDHMRGISQSIMMGRTAYIGTGCCEALQSKNSKDTNKQSTPKNNSISHFGMLYPHQHRLAKSRFRGRKMEVEQIVTTPPVYRNVDQQGSHQMALPSSSEIEAYGTDNLFIQNTGNFSSQCEPPYVDDSSFNVEPNFLWSSGDTSSKMSMLIDGSPQSIPSPTNSTPSDTAKIRKELIDMISRVPFNPPRSPQLIK